MSRLVKAARVALATLREIFDESAYERFLRRKQMLSSPSLRRVPPRLRRSQDTPSAARVISADTNPQNEGQASILQRTVKLIDFLQALRQARVCRQFGQAACLALLTRGPGPRFHIGRFRCAAPLI